MDFPGNRIFQCPSFDGRSFAAGVRVCNADSLLNPFFGGRFGSLRLQKDVMIAFSFVGTEADEFACGKCRLRWLRQQLWGLSIGSAARRIGSLERWTAKIRLSEEAFPPCGDGSGRWLCPQPFNRLYFSGMGGMDCRLFAGEKFIFAGKCRQGSVRVAGVCRKRGESVLAGQPVLADLFGAAATFCREVAVFDPTFAVGRRIAGRKLPLRAVSVFSDKRLCSYLCRAAVGRRIDGRRCFPQFMEKEIWFYITISSWSAAVMPAARRLRRQRGSAPARCS